MLFPKISSVVKVRFAPSPTGALHLGGLRTAAFNFLFSRKTAGSKFILRIEDTDKARTVPGSAKDIETILRWAGITPDASPSKPGLGNDTDYPYIQSQNLEMYRSKAEDLVRTGHAFKEFLSPESPSYVIRWKDTQSESSMVDCVLGPLSFPAPQEPDNRILLKSDGWPTYHLASVVDDHRQNITHVIRGQEWVPSIPLHIGLYKALGYKQPQFAHIPLIADESGKKLSKRDPGGSVQEYISKGYEPEALINFVLLMGWSRISSGTPISDDGYEVLDMHHVAPNFSLEDISRHQARLNPAKLDFLNMKHIERIAANKDGLLRLALKLKSHIENGNPAHLTRIRNIFDIPLMSPTLFPNVLPDFTTTEAITLRESIPPETYEKTLSKAEEILTVENASKPELEQLRSELNLPAKHMYMCLRHALMGSPKGINMSNFINIAGPEKIRALIQHALSSERERTKEESARVDNISKMEKIQ